MRGDIQLDQLRIASPCHMDWEAMQVQDGEGRGNVRHCGSCDRNVYNISGMTAAEARRVIGESGGERGGRLCVRLYLRADGTVMTADCPVGRRAARWARAKVAAWALLIAGTLTGTAAAVRSSADANAAMNGASGVSGGSGGGWIFQTRAYQTFQRWLNPAPPAAPVLLGRPILMGEIAPPPAAMPVPEPVPGDASEPENVIAHEARCSSRSW